MLELAMTPSILRGNRHEPPDGTLKTPVELMPQVDSIPATGHSGATCADETDTKNGTARMVASTVAFNARMKILPIFNHQTSPFSGYRVDLNQGGFSGNRASVGMSRRPARGLPSQVILEEFDDCIAK